MFLLRYRYFSILKVLLLCLLIITWVLFWSTALSFLAERLFLIVPILCWEWDFFFDRSIEHSLYFYNIILLKHLMCVVVCFLAINILMFFFSKTIQFETLVSGVLYIKLFSLVLYVISMCSAFIYIYLYLFIISDVNINYLNSYYMITPQYNVFNINMSMDFFGTVLLIIAYLVGLLSFLALDNKLYWKNIKLINFLNLFILIVFFYITTNNILILFLAYEFLLVPSFLLVYFLSPSRKSTQASLYFVIWTQIGSFLVLTVVFYIINVSGCVDFFLIKNYNFTTLETFLLSIILFLGFGFKVPIWPFHYWLTKTHVEAPSGFSMYLSGFLVKTALFGFYKIINIFGGELNSTLFSAICIIGIIDSSLKMWGQTDLKKLVAYGTVQEMNIIYLTFCWGDSLNIISGILFCVTHALLSSLMFYIVDIIYRRFNSRSVIEICGALQKLPNTGIVIILMCIFFSGLPGTLKFTTEFYIFTSFFDYSPVMCFTTFFIANCLGLIGFSKCWFNIVFGMSYKNVEQMLLDLSIKEAYITTLTFLLLIVTCFFSNVFF